MKLEKQNRKIEKVQYASEASSPSNLFLYFRSWGGGVVILSLFFLLCGLISVTYANPLTMHTVIDPDANLVSKNYFYPPVSFRGVSWSKWHTPDGPPEVKGGEYSLLVPAGKKSKVVGFPFDYSTMLLKELDVNFAYSLRGTGSVRIAGKSFSLREGSNLIFQKRVPVELGSSNSVIQFVCAKAGGELKFSNLVVKPVRYPPTPGKPVLLEGVPAEKICFITTNIKDTAFDKRAANLLQKNLYFAGGGVLPIIEIKTGEKPGNAILVGQAAKGCFQNETLQQVGEGGYALSVANGISAIYGRHPSGTPSGVFSFLKKLGFFYLATDEYTVPSASRLELGKIQETLTPAIPMRLDGGKNGDTMGQGMCDPYYLVDMLVLGRKYSGHTMEYFVSWEEFKDTHPDFFAMQEDGVRRPDSRRGDIHYCYSNRKLQEIMIRRVKEILRADPLGEYLVIYPGDGMNFYCRCPECTKLGKTTDRTLYFLNLIARAIRDDFPDVKLLTNSYTDTMMPPEKFKPEPNVLVLVCLYEPIWNNHLIAYHENNRLGWEALQGWLKSAPDNLGTVFYPGMNKEFLNLWPAFYADIDFFKFAAKNNSKIVSWHGLQDRGLNSSIPRQNIFASLRRNIMTGLFWDPYLDVEKAIDEYLSMYFGEGAPALREFFDLIHKEVKEKGWSCFSGRVLRGFVTQELADQGMDMFARAQTAVGNQHPFDERIRREKIYFLWSYLTDINRANGKLSPEKFSFYAACLAEFCQLAKEFKINYLGSSFTFSKWFWDTAMIQLPEKGKWEHAPVIAELIKNPQNTLGENMPRIQSKTDYGFFIPPQGMFGGEEGRSRWLRSETIPVRILRRHSSGYGMTQILLELEKNPARPIVIKVNGLDNEKPGIAQMELIINGHTIFKGDVPWQKQKWSMQEFVAPAEVWKQGDNTIQFLNSTPDIDEFTQGRETQQDYYWGWYMIDGCHFHIQ